VVTGASIELTIFIAAGCLTSFCAGAIVTYLVVNWSRDRQAEEDEKRRETLAEHGLKLAFENQKLEQRASGEQPAVEPIEVPGFMADSGYWPPRDSADFYGIPAEEGTALAATHGMHVSRGWDTDPYAPHCGCPLAPCGLVEPKAGCVQHDNQKTIRNAHTADECPAPNVDDDPPTTARVLPDHKGIRD
jgi:hypothetical protein